MTIRIYPYKMESTSAKSLAGTLGALRVRPYGRFRPRHHHTVINWGNSTPPGSWSINRPGLVLNLPSSVAQATNKLTTYLLLKEASLNVPPFTTDPTTAAAWSANGQLILARTILNGHSGAGILEIPPYTETSLIPAAPVYCTYLTKRHEYRIHVVGNTVTDFQAKRRKSAIPDSEINWHIRSNANGFVYCRTNVNPSPTTKEIAIQAVNALDLDFAAVDIIIHDDIPYILELNTAPGLSPTSIAIYAAALSEHIATRR